MAEDVPTLEEFTGVKLAVLDDYDVAVLNLCAAAGLPGTEQLDTDALLDTLDDWAERVKLEIWRHLYQFDSQASQAPTEFSYGNSLGRFFCWFMLQVLQEDCGVAYHPDRKFNPDFCQPEDLFIHGIVDKDGEGGTCASMPVVYVAVGRRLGLPVYLVQTRGHLFCRWDDPHGTTSHWDSPPIDLWIPPDRFNVEGSGEGIAYYPDSHYIQWPELWQEVDFNHGRYLHSMNVTEVLADFLIQRSESFYELGDWEECLKAIFYARQLSPDDERYKWLHSVRSRKFQAEQEHRDEMLREINERSRKAAAQGWHPQPVMPGPPVKVALGTPRPAHLPPGTRIQYVPADEADLLVGGQPLPGRVYKIATGRPRPACLPPGVPVQVVPPDQADDFSAYEIATQSPVHSPAHVSPVKQQYLEKINHIREQNERLFSRYGSKSQIAANRETR